MKRLTALAAMTVLGVALTAPAAMADDTTDTTDTSTDSSSALEEVSAYVQPSVVYLHMQWTGYIYDTFNKSYLNTNGAGDAKPFILDTQCTGYVVNPSGYIATAGHCVDPKGDVISMLQMKGAEWAAANGYYADNSLTAKQIYNFGDFRVEGLETTNKGPDRLVQAAWGVSAGGLQTGKSYTARVVKFQPFDKGDGAIIKVEATELPAITVADDSPLDIGTEIVSVGYPASVDLVTDSSFSPSFKDGTVSSSKTIQGGLLTVYEISAAVSGGMSGGPTVDLDGNVVGFNSFGIDSSIESQQFNFVRPTSIINELMADVGVENELGQVSEDYRAGLDAYFAGDKDAAVENLQAVIDAQPTNAMAADYLKKANAMEEPSAASSDGGSDFPIVPVAIGIGALLLLALLGALLMTRRRRGTGGGGGAMPAAPAGPAPAAGGWAPQPQSQPMSAPPATASPTGTPVGPMAPVSAQSEPAPQVATPPPAPVAPMASAPPAPPAQAETVGFQPTAQEPQTAAVEQQVDEAPAPVMPQQHAAFCTKCGTRAIGDQKFCGNCGAQL